MDVVYENVKEISLVTHHVFMTHNNCYTDLLRVSSGWVSYKRNDFYSKEEICSWSYKTSSNVFKQNFNNLINSFYDELHGQNKHSLITDSGDYNVRITFKDDTHIDIYRTSHFYFNGMEEQAKAFLNMIPKGEKFPDFLIGGNFHKVKLTKDVLQSINKTRLIALMYAEGGAMGIPGHIEVIDEDHIRYAVDTMDEDLGVSQFDVTSLFDGFKHRPGYDSGNMGNVKLNNEYWVYIDLGFGNHLYLRNDFYIQIGNLILDAELSKRYVNWMSLIGERE